MNRTKLSILLLLPVLLLAATVIQTELQATALLNNRIEIKIPKGFEIMKEDMLKLKYPMERRPTLVYTDVTGGINVAFNLTASRASQEQLEAYKDNFINAFKTMHPTAEWKDSGIKEINGRKTGYLELVTQAMDTKIYNLMFFTDLDGRLLLCTFNCTEKSIKEWEPLAKEIMQSLKIK
jgi:hypothetical protein